MKKKNTMSKRTTALLLAAALFLIGGSAAGTRAALTIADETFTGHFYLNHLQVHLIENGEDVCGGDNTLDAEGKMENARLATALGYEDEDNLGKVVPGKKYTEEIAAKNGTDIDQFVRLTVRKYWVVTDDEGKVIKDDEGKVQKNTELSPSLIHLTYGTGDDYNSSAWVENPQERTTESRTYYYRTDLDAGATSALLFDKVSIDASVADELVDPDPEPIVEGDTKTYIYEYKYDGYAFYIEADVQAIQTHNINDAIKSQWGVSNVTGTFTSAPDSKTGSGRLTVGQ